MNYTFRTWFEATRPYVQKLIDPALLTSDELYVIVNKQGKRHPSSAYRFSVMSSDEEWNKKENFPELLQTKIINGIKFEFRMQKKDKTKNQYVKTNEHGVPLRGPNNELLYYTSEELERLFANNKYEYTIGVFVGNTYVGGCQDEWGCVLYRVADEYQGFGLGTMLAKIAWELEPGKTSGGFTPAGYKTFLSWHREAVRDYLQSGMYSHLIKTGQITKERVQEIVASVEGATMKSFPKRKITSEKLYSDDPEDWLLMSHEGAFIIYDRKLKDIINQGDEREYWKASMVKGIIYAIDKRIKIFGGDTPQIKKFLLTLALMDAENHSLYVEPEDLQFVDKKIMKVEPDSVEAGYRSSLVTLKQKLDRAAIRKMILEERKFRKSFDKYDEFKIQVIEMAYAKFGYTK